MVSSDGVAETRITGICAEVPAHHRHVARLIDDAILLLERLLMLLIDDDQAEIAERQEQGRARADHDLGIAARRPRARSGAARDR